MIRFQSLPRQRRCEIRDEVLRLYAETDSSYAEIAEEFGISMRSVEYIVRKFAGKLAQLPMMRKKKIDTTSADIDAMRAEITRLHKELRQQRMRADLLDTMIDVAEETLNIEIRKKAGTKQ